MAQRVTARGRLERLTPPNHRPRVLIALNALSNSAVPQHCSSNASPNLQPPLLFRDSNSRRARPIAAPLAAAELGRHHAHGQHPRRRQAGDHAPQPALDLLSAARRRPGGGKSARVCGMRARPTARDPLHRARTAAAAAVAGAAAAGGEMDRLLD